MAQELAPKGRSMVASLMMGFAYGLGGAFSPLVGKIADMTSIQATLFVLSFMPLVTVGLILFFPRVRGRSHSAPEAGARKSRKEKTVGSR